MCPSKDKVSEIQLESCGLFDSVALQVYLLESWRSENSIEDKAIVNRRGLDLVNLGLVKQIC